MPDRDAEFTISAKDRSGPAVEGAADGFERMGNQASKAERKLDSLGDESGQLARKLLEAKAAAAALAREFDKTGDAKILKDFDKISREATKLGRVMKSMKIEAPSIDAPTGMFGKLLAGASKAGIAVGSATIEGITGALNKLPGGQVLFGGLAAAAVAYAPILAGALQGAVLAGIATGGIAGGLILAAKDERVKVAYGALGTDIMTRLKESVGKPFADQLLATAPKLSTAFDEQEPRLRRIASSLASTLGPIFNKGLEAINKIMPSIERAAITGGFILRDLAQQLPALAGSVGKLLDAFSAGGPGAAAAIGLIIFQLRQMINILAFGAQASAPFLNFFGKLAEVTNFVPKSSGEIGVLSTLISSSGTSASIAAMQYGALGNALGNTADKANALNEAFNRMFGEEMAVQQANLAVNVGMMALTETLKGNKKTLDQNTEAGAQNAGVILQQIQALDQKRQADIAAGNGTASATAAANAAYASQVGALRALLIQMGFTAAAVDALIGKLYAIPKNITTTITTVFRTVGNQSGLSDQATGHSRTGTADYSALSGWRPAQFAAQSRGQFAAGGGGVHQPPVEVHSQSNVTVELDGIPFAARIVRSIAAAEKRQAWRAKVGRR